MGTNVSNEQQAAMRTKALKEKRSELMRMPHNAFIDRICDYPDQWYLNRDENSNLRKYQVGIMARTIRKHDYQMSDKQYYALIYQFSDLTVPYANVTDVQDISSSISNTSQIQHSKPFIFGGKQIYETEFVLQPESSNQPGCPVKVLIPKTDGTLCHIGYLPKGLRRVVDYEIAVRGSIEYPKDGTVKKPEFFILMDTEELEYSKHSRLEFTDEDLHGIGDLSLDKPPILDDAPHENQDMSVHMDGYVYEMPFAMNGKLKDPAAASKYFADLALGSKLSHEFTKKGLPNTIEWMNYHFDVSVSQPKLNPSRLDILPDTITGTVRLISNKPLSDKQLMVATDFVHRVQEGGALSIRLQNEDFVDIPQSVDVFRKSHDLFESIDNKTQRIESQLELTDADLNFAQESLLPEFGL